MSKDKNSTLTFLPTSLVLDRLTLLIKLMVTRVVVNSSDVIFTAPNIQAHTVEMMVTDFSSLSYNLESDINNAADIYLLLLLLLFNHVCDSCRYESPKHQVNDNYWTIVQFWAKLFPYNRICWNELLPTKRKQKLTKKTNISSTKPFQWPPIKLYGMNICS